MGSRTWIKIYCQKWIVGSLRGETAEIRGIWADLLALAGSGQFGDTGEIKLINGIGYTDEQIAGILHIPLETWKAAKQRLKSTQRINISPNGAIYIINWTKYQSEYNRQKKYRESTHEISGEPKRVFNNFLKENEKEIEKESEKLQKENITKSYKENIYNRTSNNIYGDGQLNPSADVSIKAKESVTNSADSNRKSTIRERVNQYLKEHGASQSSDISRALGMSAQGIAVFFIQHKKEYSHIGKGIWSLPVGDTGKPEEQVKVNLCVSDEADEAIATTVERIEDDSYDSIPY